VTAAIAAVSRGEAYFSAAFARMKTARHADPHAFDKVLTDREIVVLSLIGDLLTDSEIGEKLDMADRTAQKHRFNIMAKLSVSSRAELERFARKHGFRQSVVRDQPPPGM
jgi:DNA-binding NarL/FixJ family response regulator